MPYYTLKDNTQIFYKDWGSGEPLFFHHGWPLSSDDWDAQLMFFLNKGYRVIAHDRRGHGRSTQTTDGHDMDTYASDVLELTAHLGLNDAVHVGHSTGGGEAIRYAARADKGRVKKVVLVSAVTPHLAQTPDNPEGVPMEVFDGLREGTATKRAQFFKEVPIKFYNFDRPSNPVQPGFVDNWLRQGINGGINAHYHGIKAFSEVDLTGDLKSVDVPVLVLHGEDDQIVPLEAAGARAVKLLKHGKLTTYPGYSHGMLTTHPKKINSDLLAFIKE